MHLLPQALTLVSPSHGTCPAATLHLSLQHSAAAKQTPHTAKPAGEPLPLGRGPEGPKSFTRNGAWQTQPAATLGPQAEAPSS